MTTTFYVTWAAYILTSILTMAGITLSYSVTIISSLLTKSGAVVYPLIYIFFFDEVRDDINKLSYESGMHNMQNMPCLREKNHHFPFF